MNDLKSLRPTLQIQMVNWVSNFDKCEDWVQFFATGLATGLAVQSQTASAKLDCAHTGKKVPEAAVGRYL